MAPHRDPTNTSRRVHSRPHPILTEVPNPCDHNDPTSERNRRGRRVRDRCIFWSDLSVASQNTPPATFPMPFPLTPFDSSLPISPPQMHLRGWTRGESIPHRHPIATWYMPLARSTPRPLKSLCSQKKTSPSLAAGFRNNTIIHKCTSVSLEPLQGRRATPVPPHGPDAVGVHTLRRFKQWLGKRCSRLSLLWFPLEASNSSSSWILALHRTLQFHPNLQYHGI